jgi:hypothetical protein
MGLRGIKEENAQWGVLCVLTPSGNINQPFKLKRLRLGGRHLAYSGEKRNARWIWRKYLNERNHLEERNLDGRIERSWILKKWDWRAKCTSD